MKGLEFIKFIKRFEVCIKILNKKYNFTLKGNDRIKYNCNLFDENDDEFLINLNNYIDDLNEIMDNEFDVHFSYNYLSDGTIRLFPDYIGGKETGLW